MGDKKRIVLQPEYMKKFSCIGSECEDSCCIGWRVDLDKKSYLKYKKVQNKELKPIIEKMVNRKHSQKTDEMYGKIKMDGNGMCPFLNQEKLCKVYLNIGEEYLSDTCTFYPRIVKKVDNNLERSATISCPEVARLCLLNPNGIAFENIEEDDDLRIKVSSEFNTEVDSNINKAQKYFWDIRIFSLTLLQNRNYNLGERLIILGIVYKKIDSLCLNNEINELPSMLEAMSNMIEDKGLKEEINKIPTNISIQMRLAKGMTDKKIVQGIQSERYIDCLRKTLIGIGCVDEVNNEIMAEKYEDNYKKFVEPYLKEKEYILENYLVNECFKEIMPFGDFQSMWDSYIFICVLYSMTKLHIIGISGYYKELNDELIIEVIQSLSKVVLHNNSYIQGIIKLLKDNELDSLAYMSILVNN